MLTWCKGGLEARNCASDKLRGIEREGESTYRAPGTFHILSHEVREPKRGCSRSHNQPQDSGTELPLISPEPKPSDSSVESPGFPEREPQRAPAGSGSMLGHAESRGRDLSQTGVPSPPEGRVKVAVQRPGAGESGPVPEEDGLWEPRGSASSGPERECQGPGPRL